MSQEYLENVLMKTIELYTKGTLRQYGLTDEATLEIVANVTNIPKDKLIEIKQQRTEQIANSFDKSQEIINNIVMR